MEKRNRSCKFTIEQERQIIAEYQNGLSLRTLGIKYSCDATTISNIMKAYGVERRTLSSARRNYLNYTLNENIFEEIDTPDKAYWLGVMYSDGYIGKTSAYTNILGLSVSEKDVEWVEKFKEFLGYNGEIHHYKVTSGYKIGAPYVRLVVGNNKIVSDIEKWGVVEHKTKKINQMPDIPYKDDFIRGYIDGDGALLTKRPGFLISGNEDFLLDIAKYLNIPYMIYQDKSIYSLRYNRKESEYLEKRLYKNAHYYLQRKYDLAKRSFDSPVTLEDVM